jgi:hypothetical protein
MNRPAACIPAIAAIRAAGIDLPITVDTTRAPVARAALEAGADAINDVAAGEEDDAMLSLASERGCGMILMHRLRPPAQDRFSDRPRLPSRLSRGRRLRPSLPIYTAASGPPCGRVCPPRHCLTDPGSGLRQVRRAEPRPGPSDPDPAGAGLPGPQRPFPQELRRPDRAPARLRPRRTPARHPGPLRPPSPDRGPPVPHPRHRGPPPGPRRGLGLPSAAPPRTLTLSPNHPAPPDPGLPPYHPIPGTDPGHRPAKGRTRWPTPM